VETSITVSDAALGDADAVFALAVRHIAQKYAAIHPLPVGAIAAGRAEAIADLDRWAGGSAANWRLELVRFYESHAPSALRPDPALNAALRRAARAGVAVTVASPLPADAVELYLAQLGVRRSIAAIVDDGGDGVIEDRARLLELLG
jgi:phosphoglycolate phosphatase-like HAD superfamily hydrolase